MNPRARNVQDMHPATPLIFAAAVVSTVTLIGWGMASVIANTAQFIVATEAAQ